MTKRCTTCKQPITNTPYHFQYGNRNYCQKHCHCANCMPVESTTHEEQKADDDGMAPILGAVLATELISEALSSDNSTDSPSEPAPDPTPDFGGFDGGQSGGGGASGDF